MTIGRSTIPGVIVTGGVNSQEHRMVCRLGNDDGVSDAAFFSLPIIWRRQIDGSLEGRTLGLDYVFWVHFEKGSWWIGVMGQGQEQVRKFAKVEQARDWLEEVRQGLSQSYRCWPLASA